MLSIYCQNKLWFGEIPNNKLYFLCCSQEHKKTMSPKPSGGMKVGGKSSKGSQSSIFILPVLYSYDIVVCSVFSLDPACIEATLHDLCTFLYHNILFSFL